MRCVFLLPPERLNEYLFFAVISLFSVFSFLHLLVYCCLFFSGGIVVVVLGVCCVISGLWTVG